MDELISAIVNEAEQAWLFFEAVLDYSQNDCFSHQHTFFDDAESMFLSGLAKTADTIECFKKSHLLRHLDEGAQTNASLEVFHILRQQLTNEQLDSYFFTWNAGNYRLTFTTNSD